ncbi:MAG: hypothetical protein M1828_000463 [Chrysothrix sp. TS-e1954]|nr:MAG: hypothetical protein M1828_000463 [Chrysothrix sp. TS-e1954]
MANTPLGHVSVQTLLPIPQLDPTNQPPTQSIIKAVVTLIWPYSSSSETLAILVAEPDFRLRHRKGQVRIVLRGPAANALAASKLANGDLVSICLDGAVWNHDITTQHTPGRSVEGNLLFTHRLKVTIERNGEYFASLDVDDSRAPLSPVRLSTPEPVVVSQTVSSISRPFRNRETWASPAFSRQSSNFQASCPLDDAYLQDDEDYDEQDDGTVLGRPSKRTKYSRRSNEWRYVSGAKSTLESKEDVPTASTLPQRSPSRAAIQSFDGAFDSPPRELNSTDNGQAHLTDSVASLQIASTDKDMPEILPTHRLPTSLTQAASSPEKSQNVERQERKDYQHVGHPTHLDMIVTGSRDAPVPPPRPPDSPRLEAVDSSELPLISPFPGSLANNVSNSANPGLLESSLPETILQRLETEDTRAEGSKNSQTQFSNTNNVVTQPALDSRQMPSDYVDSLPPPDDHQQNIAMKGVPVPSRPLIPQLDGTSFATPVMDVAETHESLTETLTEQGLVESASIEQQAQRDTDVAAAGAALGSSFQDRGIHLNPSVTIHKPEVMQKDPFTPEASQETPQVVEVFETPLALPQDRGLPLTPQVSDLQSNETLTVNEHSRSRLVLGDEQHAHQGLYKTLDDVPKSLSPWFTSSRSSKLRKGTSERNQANESPLPRQPSRLSRKKYRPLSETQGPLQALKPVVAASGETPDRTLKSQIGFTTPLSYYAPLSALETYLTASSPEGSVTIDVFAIVTSLSSKPTRAKAGPKDYSTMMHVADRSTYPETSQVQCFRPFQRFLPVADVGDVIILRSFLVRSRQRECYLLSTEDSGWYVWRFAKYEGSSREEANGDDSSEAKKSDAPGLSAVIRLGECNGPPVETGNEEHRHARSLHKWFVELRERGLDVSAHVSPPQNRTAKI